MNGTPAKPDPAAAYLAEVRERRDTAENARWHDYATALELVSKALRSTADIPRLLGAVEAVLAVHKPDGVVGDVTLCDEHLIWRPPLTEAIRQERIACPDCVVSERPRCWHSGCPDEWPCPTYAAITRELLKEDGTDGN